ncbi:MAG TPA: hypothetical protein VFK86_20140 [Bauldia sp.]|nr:hypothetical protein [Bauldia sp.]
MSVPWYAVADSRSDAAWELYHENAKRGRSDGAPLPRTPVASPDYGGLPLVALGESLPQDPPQRPGALRPGAGPVPLRTLSEILAAGCRPLIPADPVEGFVCVLSVEAAPRGLAWYDAEAHGLRLIRRDDVLADVAHALAAPGILRHAAALIFLAGNLDAATAQAGERGYRDALIAVGRHVAALETASVAAGLRIEDGVPFYDREVDALFHLDGLSRSMLHAVAVGASRG